MKRYYPNAGTVPLVSTIAVWLLLDRFQAPSWVLGVFWTLVAIVWIACLAHLGTLVFGDEEVLSANEVERRLRILEGRQPFGPKP